MEPNASSSGDVFLPSSTVTPLGDVSAGDIFYAVLYGLLSLFGAVGNCLTILVVVTDRKLRSHTANYLIVNLAAADMLVFVVIEPFLSLSRTIKSWPFSGPLCTTLAVLILKHMIVSDVIMASIAVNRYCSIVRHQRYHQMFTPRRTLLLCFASWVPGLAMILAQLIPPYYATFSSYYGVCVVILQDTKLHKALSLLSGLVILASIFVSSCCYLQIYRTVRESRKRVRPNLQPRGGDIFLCDPTSQRDSNAVETIPSRPLVMNRDNQATKADIALSLNLFIVFAVFCVCWTPLAVIILLENIHSGFTSNSGYFPYWVWPAAYKLVLFNSTLNIFIYAWKNRNFRSAYAKLLRCRKCVR